MKRSTIWRLSRDGLDLHYELAPHPGQYVALRSGARFTFVLAGSQAGKTSFGPWWLDQEIGRRGAGDYLAVTASYDLFKLKMLPEMRLVFEHLLKYGRYWSGDRVMELADPETGQFWAKGKDDPMWGRIILRSAQSPGGLESATAKAGWLDECGQDDFSLESWEAIQRRLALHEGRVLGTTTLYNTGWLKSEVYDRWTGGDPDYKVIQFPSTLNPVFPRKEFDRMKRTLPDWRFQMFYLGQFARPAGLIYGDFTDEMLEDPFPIPADWPRVVGIDFGGANLALVWLAQDKGGTWHLYHESLSGDRTTAEHARRTLARAAGCTEIAYVGGAKSESQERRDWRAEGVRVLEPPIGGLEPGIDRVISLMKTGKFRLFRTCKGLRDELGTYRRKLNDAGEPTEEIVDKRAFHRLDALRYAACQITSGRSFQYGFV